jgi:hypothetical protein
MVASLISHPILDMFQTYTPILYPFLGSVFVDVKAGFLFGVGLKPYFELSVHTAAFDSHPSPALTDHCLRMKHFQYRLF